MWGKKKHNLSSTLGILEKVTDHIVNMGGISVACFAMIGAVFYIFKFDEFIEHEPIPYFYLINFFFVVACVFIAEFNKYFWPILIVGCVLILMALDAIYINNEYFREDFESFCITLFRTYRDHLIPFMIVTILVAIPLMTFREFYLIKKGREKGWPRLSQKLYLRYTLKNTSWGVKYGKPYKYFSKYSWLLLLIAMPYFLYKPITDFLERLCEYPVFCEWLSNKIYGEGFTFSKMKIILTGVLILSAIYIILKIRNRTDILFDFFAKLLDIIKWSFFFAWPISYILHIVYFAFTYSRWLTILEKNKGTQIQLFIDGLIVYYIGVSLACFVVLFVILSLKRMFYREPREQFDVFNDPWNPANNPLPDITQLKWIATCDLMNEDIVNIKKLLEHEISKQHKAREGMRGFIEKWNNVADLPDKEFNEQYDGTGDRRHVYNRADIAEIKNMFLYKIETLDHNIKKANERMTEIITFLPKQKGMSKPSKLAGFDGLNVTPISDLNKLDNNDKHINE